MNPQEIEKIVKDALSEVTGTKASDIRLDQHLIHDLEMESIDIVDFSFELEKRTNLTLNLFDFFQVTQMRSEDDFYDPFVKDVIAYVNKVNLESKK